MPNSEEERFARLLARLSPAQRQAYLEKQANAARLRQIVAAIESGSDSPTGDKADDLKCAGPHGT